MPNKIETRATEKSTATVRKPQPAARPKRDQINPAHALLRAQALPASELWAADLLTLQRVAGNRAVEQLLGDSLQHQQQSRLILQAKLAVGAADDSYEREADRIAAMVVQSSGPAAARIQRRSSPLASVITSIIEQRVDGGPDSVEPGIAPDIERGVERARTSGQQLPGDFRARMEQAFGADFSRVRVHADSQADGLNRSLESRAFTNGQDMFFKSGEYNPANRRGQELIAHELTHVVQQNGGATSKHGLPVQRATSNVIQRSIADGLRADRFMWKTLPTNLKIPLVVAAPILGTLGQMWESGRDTASSVYNRLAGDNPSVIRAVLSGLLATPGALIGGVYGAVKGFLNGLTFGIGNPLYSMGKRLVKGAIAIPETISEARGFYDADPGGKYGNLPDQTRRENYKADTKTDLANYLLLATGAASSVGAVFTQKGVILAEGKNFFTDSLPLLSETGKALSHMGAVSGGVGAFTSLWDAKKGYAEWKDSASSREQQKIGASRVLSGIASATQQSATAAYHIGNLSQSAVAATAQAVTGGAGIATGAVDILRGLYARSKANQNIERLTALEQRESLQGREGRDIRKAAQQATSTQEMRKTTATATMAKGALTVAGGALLVASAATPIGWALLGAGALIGGVYALKKWWDKRTRKEEVAMRELKVTKTERGYWEKDVENIKKRTWWGSNERKVALNNLGPDPLQRKLDQFGFKSVGHFYANYIHYMANHLYDKAVDGKTDLNIQVSQAIEDRRARGIPVRRLVLADLYRLSYKQMRQRIDDERIRVDMRQNHYPEVEELLGGMGLKFDWQQIPAQPTPDKIGKALDE